MIWLCLDLWFQITFASWSWSKLFSWACQMILLMLGMIIESFVYTRFYMALYKLFQHSWNVSLLISVVIFSSMTDSLYTESLVSREISKSHLENSFCGARDVNKIRYSQNANHIPVGSIWTPSPYFLVCLHICKCKLNLL